MAETTNNLGYNTYIIGTAKNITDCLEIIVYNKSILTVEDQVENINIYNISQVISELNRTGKCIYLQRNTNQDYFQYLTDNGVIPGFNVVIYLQAGTRTGIGYTEFINIQGKYRNISITLDSKTEVEGNLEISISNSLVLANSDSSRTWTGEELNDYTLGKSLKKYKLEKEDSLLSPTGYTTHLSAFGNNLKSESNIWLGGVGIVLGKTENLNTLTIARNFNSDPWGLDFTHYYIGWYENSDISFYNWERLRYSISSLSKTNRFGVPIRHTTSEGGWDEITGIDPNRYRIIGWEGKYAIVEDSLSSDRRLVWDTIEKRIIGDGKVFINGSSPHYEVVSLPSVSYYTNILSEVPDLGNTFYDIAYYGMGNYINIIFRRGNWFVFRQGDLVVWSSLKGSLTTAWTELERTFPITDSYIGVLSEDKTTFTIFSGGDNWITDSAGEIKGMSSEERDKHISAKQNGRIQVCSGPLGDTWLKNFRRNIYPIFGYPGVESIIGCLAGLIFYKNNGQINYL